MGLRLDHPSLQDLLDESAARLAVAGAQCAVLARGEVLEAATGTANLRTQEPVTTATRFQIGSTTKVFTAALVMTLVDEGVVDLDEPVVAYLPALRFADPAATSAVTLRHLLSMTAGIDNGPYSDHGPGDDCVARYVDAFADVATLFGPGEGFGYSNAATVVAGRVVEVVTGSVWDDALRERVLSPAGLARSTTRLEEIVLDSVAVGHAAGEAGPEPVAAWALPRALGPAGSTLCSTAGDLVRLGGLFLDDGTVADGTTVLSADAVKVMHAPQVELPVRAIAEAWGVGPYIRRAGDVSIHGHSGTNTGGSSWLLWVPGHDVAVATITNSPRLGYPLAAAVVGEVFAGLGVPLPDPVTPDETLAVELDRYTGAYAAFGVVYGMSARDGVLHMAARAGDEILVETDLLPVSRDRFVPTNPAASGQRDWDVAFWGDDGAGAATHYLNGLFASRRA